MTRREFRIIAGQCTGSPERQATSRRHATRREFKTIHCGVGSQRGPRLQAITIKCIDKTDGTTVWEYGPGSLWRHHYGVDAISGVVPNLSATLDKYAIAAGDYPTYAACGNRNTATLVANVCEPLSVFKLDSLDGTTIESATLTGLFCDTITGTSVGLVNGLRMTNAAALSGGDYVIVGERIPFIEFLSFTSNGATKSYILHAHALIGGNVYLKTRTSNETITIPYDSTAAEVETLFEATSDCTAATVTGGPWPLLPITVEATWSASSGDISGIAMTSTQSAVGGTTTWSSTTGNWATDIDYLTLNVSAIAEGATFTFSLIDGPDFTYVSTTDIPSVFLAALEAAIESFSLDQADTGWMSIASGIPDSVFVIGNELTILYSTALGFDPVTVDLTAGGDPTTDTRNTKSAAIVYDTGTGGITSSVGYRFGYSAVRTPAKMFEESAALPTVTGLDVLGIMAIGSGPDNSVIVTPIGRNSGDAIKESVVEAWTIASGEWTFNWQVYCNATMLMPQIIQCESGYILCPIGAKRFDGVRDRTAAKISVADAARTEVMTHYGTLTVPDNWQSSAMFDSDASKYLTWGFELTYLSSINGRPIATYNDRGRDTWADGDYLRIGATAFASDGTAVFAKSPGKIDGGWYYDTIGSSSDHEAFFRFITPYNSRAAEPQQFRFKIERMPGVNYTAWIDWYATETEIETALNDLLGAGNVALIDFGLDPTPVENDPVALIEFNPLFRFYTDAGFTPGSGYIPRFWFDYRNDGVLTGGVEIEMQNITPFTTPEGICAYSVTDATKLWSRPFGTKDAFTVSDPIYAWLQGDFVYAYGSLVDSEL